jgi:hypothetical protein
MYRACVVETAICIVRITARGLPRSTLNGIVNQSQLFKPLGFYPALLMSRTGEPSALTLKYLAGMP